MRKNSFLLLMLIPIFIQCKTQNNIKRITGYEYIDGNGNLYDISSTTILYDPITPEESSTGTYSGGEPYYVNITIEQFNGLEAIFKKLILDRKGLSDKPSLGTGTLVVLPKRATYFFSINSSQKKEIEDSIHLITQK